jgi:hypothetical protein
VCHVCCPQVLGSHYQAQLLEVIPADNLPERFGGRSVCDLSQDVGPWQSLAPPAPAPTKSGAAAAGAAAVGATAGPVVAINAAAAAAPGQLGPASPAALVKQQQLERQGSGASCGSSGLIPAALDAGLSSVRATAGSCHDMSALRLNDDVDSPAGATGEVVADGVMVVA